MALDLLSLLLHRRNPLNPAVGDQAVPYSPYDSLMGLPPAAAASMQSMDPGGYATDAAFGDLPSRKKRAPAKSTITDADTLALIGRGRMLQDQAAAQGADTRNGGVNPQVNDHSTKRFWEDLLLFGGEGAGMLKRQRQDAQALAIAKDAEQRQLAAQADALKLKGLERDAYIADHSGFAETTNKLRQGVDIAPGHVFHLPLGGADVAAPVVDKFDDRFGSFDPLTKETKFGPARGPTYAEETDRNKPIILSEGAKAIPGTAMAAGAQVAPAGATGNFEDFYTHYLAPAEGGYAPNDGNGAPVNFGINQGANPDVSVKDLTPEKAKQLTYERYWKPSGADSLPAGLAEVQADTAFNMGIPAAQRLLKESGGDVQKYLALREARYHAIAAANPDKAQFLPTWLDRNQRLAGYVGGHGPGATGGDPPGTVYGNPKQPTPPTGYRYKGDGSLEPIPGGPAAPGGAEAANGLTGEDYLKTLPPQQQSVVKMMVDGRLPITGNALRNPQMLALIQQAGQYEPGFDATTWRARNTARTAFSSGVQGQNLTSLNTAIGHLATLADSIDKLRNFGGMGTLLNRPANALAAATDPDYQRARAEFDTARGTVASELVRALRGTGGAEADIKYWLKLFDPDKSPDSLKSGVQTAVELINSRLDPLRAQYQNVMGPSSDPLVAIYPHAAETLARLQAHGAAPQGGGGGARQSAGGGGPPNQPQAAPAAPRVGEVRQGYRFKGGNPGDPNSWARVQ